MATKFCLRAYIRGKSDVHADTGSPIAATRNQVVINDGKENVHFLTGLPQAKIPPRYVPVMPSSFIVHRREIFIPTSLSFKQLR